MDKKYTVRMNRKVPCEYASSSLTEMSKEDWEKMGINETNADFIRAEDMEE